jgi:hypothetical protein
VVGFAGTKSGDAQILPDSGHLRWVSFNIMVLGTLSCAWAKNPGTLSALSQEGVGNVSRSGAKLYIEFIDQETQ